MLKRGVIMLPAPLPIMIVDILKRRGSPMRDKELYNELTRILGVEVSMRDFNKALMVLEIRKIIYVENIKRNLRLIHPLNLKS